MGGFVRRIVSLLVVGSVAAFAASMLYAAQLKRRTVTSGEPATDEIELVAVFDSLAFISTATAFRGGSVLCYYGGGVLDLRQATLDPAGAHLSLTAIFGGGQLLVPETWRIENRVRGIFGGVGPRRPEVAGADAPTLTLDGLALFGGWGIATEAPEGTDRWIEKMHARAAKS